MSLPTKELERAVMVTGCLFVLLVAALVITYYGGLSEPYKSITPDVREAAIGADRLYGGSLDDRPRRKPGENAEQFLDRWARYYSDNVNRIKQRNR